jgi:hypothetical protein
VDAPLAVRVAEIPGHTTEGLLTAVTVGLGFTWTKTVFVPMHPDAFLPLTV